MVLTASGCASWSREYRGTVSSGTSGCERARSLTIGRSSKLFLLPYMVQSERPWIHRTSFLDGSEQLVAASCTSKGEATDVDLLCRGHGDGRLHSHYHALCNRRPPGCLYNRRMEQLSAAAVDSCFLRIRHDRSFHLSALCARDAAISQQDRRRYTGALMEKPSVDRS